MDRNHPKPVLRLLALCLLWSACQVQPSLPQPEKPELAGDPQQGREMLASYGCGSCHTIPGVTSADATVGPPLNAWSERQFISGRLANTPENLIRWIQDPQAIEPGTAMPDAGVSDEDARHMSAFLFTLRKDNRGSWP